MPYADVNGQRIYYEDTGGNGTPIILMHGFMLDHELWKPQISALSGEFRCIAWDARGHGRTPATEHFTYWDAAEDALALAAQLDADRAFYVGMSMGGFTAFRAALLAPERVLGIAAIATPPGPDPDHLNALTLAYFEEWAANGLSDRIAQHFSDLLFSSEVDGSDWVAKWRAWPRENFPYVTKAIIEREDLTPRLGEITVPTIVEHGADDIIPIEVAKQMAEALANCEQFVRVPGAYHGVNLTHPNEINQPLVEFLRRHRP